MMNHVPSVLTLIDLNPNQMNNNEWDIYKCNISYMIYNLHMYILYMQKNI